MYTYLVLYPGTLDIYYITRSYQDAVANCPDDYEIITEEELMNELALNAFEASYC